MFGGLVAIAVGLFLIARPGWGLVEALRKRGRLVRTTGVVVGSKDVLHAGGPQVRSRSGVFRFQTADGQVVESSSSFSSPRGLKAGKRVNVIYDPADPAGSGEIRWVHHIEKAFVLPLAVVVGVVLVIIGINYVMG